MDQAQAEALWATLRDSLASAAEARRQARELGMPMPDDVLQELLNTRAMLRDAGLSEDQINATPGMELPLA